jgi:hypothetical protein
MLTKISKMLRNFRLRDLENFLEVTDAKRSMCEQVDDAQSRGIAKALIDPNQFHKWIICYSKYICQCLYVCSLIRTAGSLIGENAACLAALQKKLRPDSLSPVFINGEPNMSETNLDIRDKVRERYADIAGNEGSCCGDEPSCGCSVSEQIGYSKEDLAS